MLFRGGCAPHLQERIAGRWQALALPAYNPRDTGSGERELADEVRKDARAGQ